MAYDKKAALPSKAASRSMGDQPAVRLKYKGSGQAGRLEKLIKILSAGVASLQMQSVFMLKRAGVAWAGARQAAQAWFVCAGTR